MCHNKTKKKETKMDPLSLDTDLEKKRPEVTSGSTDPVETNGSSNSVESPTTNAGTFKTDESDAKVIEAHDNSQQIMHNFETIQAVLTQFEENLNKIVDHVNKLGNQIKINCNNINKTVNYINTDVKQNFNKLESQVLVTRVNES